jgi:hypothetical protein
MHPSISLLGFYGVFLISCGIISVCFIGMKAKTALISGGGSGTLCLVIAYYMSHQQPWAFIAGFVITMGLSVVFSWRATKTLFSLFNMIQQQSKDIKGKGIAFLIISLMCVISVFTSAMQFVFFCIH